MSLIDALPELDSEPSAAFAARPHNAALDLRRQTAAVRVSFTWFGTRRKVTSDQRDEMARPFDAESDSISASKKLVNTKHPQFRALTKIKGQIKAYWEDNSLPFPEDGVRLIKQSALNDFEANMGSLRDDLALAVHALAEHYEELREEAKRRLGSLFDPGDYPASLDGLFAVSWDYPSVEPPDYLLELNPQLYEQERQRVTQRFDEAVRLAEQAFATEFSTIVTGLCESLAGRRENGEAKTLKEGAIRSTLEFFERFKSLRIGDSTALDALVDQAQDAIRGVSAKALRVNGDVRVTVAEQLGAVRQQLEALVVEKPRRRILRPTPAPEPTNDPVDQP
jgi:hypothetical protein